MQLLQSAFFIRLFGIAGVKERDRQLEALKKASGDAEALKAEIEKLQGENKAAAAKYASDLKALQISNAVERELTAAGAKNLKAVKALLIIIFMLH